jgi:hypothetical protein
LPLNPHIPHLYGTNTACRGTLVCVKSAPITRVESLCPLRNTCFLTRRVSSELAN